MDKYLLDLMHKAGRETLKYFRDTNLSVETKGEGGKDIFTQADIASNNIIIDGLESIGVRQILSEESSAEGVFDWNDEVRIVDPIDGTSLFIKGEEEYCVLLAKHVSGEIVLGIAHFPVLNETFFAEKDNGCWRVIGSGEPKRLLLQEKSLTFDACKIRIHPERESDEESMMLLYSLVSSEGIEQKKVIFGRETRNFLIGKLDFFIESYPRLGKRDIAPSTLFVKEAGGFLCYIDGEKIDFTTDTHNSSIPIIVGNIGLKGDILDRLS